MVWQLLAHFVNLLTSILEEHKAFYLLAIRVVLSWAEQRGGGLTGNNIAASDGCVPIIILGLIFLLSVATLLLYIDGT